VVDEVAIDPYFNTVTLTFDQHVVPFAYGFFRSIGEVQNSATFAFGNTPVVFGPSPFFHVWNRDVFHNAPEIAGVLMKHLHLNRLWKHFIEGAWRRCMHENSAVTRNTREAVLHFQSIIFIDIVCDEMSAWRT
jgi:hypothetical protein